MKTIKYTVEEINDLATYVLRILSSNRSIMWSWGFSKPTAVVFREMKALRFHVQGFLHKGYVVVALNEGMDCFEVYKLDENLKAQPDEQQEVDSDMLVDTIDRMVETESPNSIEYQSQVFAHLFQ